jgi:hypothetical protein
MKIIKFIIALLLVAGIAACKKDKNNNPKPSAEYYFVGSVGGKDINWETTDSGTGYGLGAFNFLAGQQPETYGEIGASIGYYPGNAPELSISFQTFYIKAGQDTTQVFNSFVNMGTWAFANTNTVQKGDRLVVVRYRDGTGKLYSSVGSQKNSSIQLVSVTTASHQGFAYTKGLKIKFQVNCQVYPLDDTGDPIDGAKPIKVTGEGTLFLEDAFYDPRQN